MVAVPAEALTVMLPSFPPGRDKSCNGLDDQDTTAAGRAIDQTRQHHVARRIGQFVDRKGGNDCRRGSRQLRARHVVAAYAASQAEVTIRLRGFVHRPRVPIDARYSRWNCAGCRPCGARCAGTTSEIDQQLE